MDEEKKLIIAGKIKQDQTLKDFQPPLLEILADPSKLSETSVFNLLNYFFYVKWTGLIDVKKDDETIVKIYFTSGSIVSAEKEGEEIEDELGRRLIKDRIINEKTFDDARIKSKETGKTLPQILFEEGHVTPRTLVETIRGIKEERLKELLLIKEGTYTCVEKAQPAKITDPIRIEPLFFLIKYMRDRLSTVSFREIEEKLESYMGRFPVKKSTLSPLIEGTILSDKERKILNEIVDGSSTLKDVFSLSLLSRNATARLFFIMTIFGIIEYRMTPLPKGGIEVFEKQLEEIYERKEKEDYFVRLEIHWSVHPEKIEKAFSEMTKKYGPLSDAREYSEKCRELCEKIYTLMVDAYEILKEKNSRREYREKLLGVSKLRFGAEFLYKQANLTLFKGDAEKAKMIIESAIDIFPADEYIEFKKRI